MANEKLDLIDRKALIAEYDRVHIGPPGGARKLMEDAPSVEAVEVVHGRWNELDSAADYQCSVCGFRFTSGDPISMFPYCRCGAKMDGERRE